MTKWRSRAARTFSAAARRSAFAPASSRDGRRERRRDFVAAIPLMLWFGRGRGSCSTNGICSRGTV